MAKVYSNKELSGMKLRDIDPSRFERKRGNPLRVMVFLLIVVMVLMFLAGLYIVLCGTPYQCALSHLGSVAQSAKEQVCK